MEELTDALSRSVVARSEMCPWVAAALCRLNVPSPPIHSPTPFARLGRLAPSSEVLAEIAGDARFDTLLRRITDLARQLPPAYAVFVLSALARFCTPTAIATDLSPASNPTVRGLLRALQSRVDAGMATLSPISLCTVAYSFARLRFIPRPPAALVVAAGAGELEGLPAKGGGGSGSGAAVWWRHFVDAASNRLIEFSAWELCQLIRSLLIVQVSMPPGETLLTPSFLNLAFKCAEVRIGVVGWVVEPALCVCSIHNPMTPPITRAHTHTHKQTHTHSASSSRRSRRGTWRGWPPP